MHRWHEAEQYYRACSERYENSCLEWFYFCKRTGKGDLKSAEKFADASIIRTANMVSKPEGGDASLYYLIKKQPEKALAEIEKTITDELNPLLKFWAALIADEAKNTKKRDELLKCVQDEIRKVKSAALEKKTGTKELETFETVINLIVDDLAKGGKGEIDVIAVEKSLVKTADSDERKI